MSFVVDYQGRWIGECIIDNLAQITMKHVMEYGGLIIDYIGNKFTYFGSNGVVVFAWLPKKILYPQKNLPHK
jgi:hypothetical protein